MADEAHIKELALFKNEYAYMQDVTKGTLKIYTGPTTLNQTAQEVPVRYENGEFIRCHALGDAKRRWPFAPEGFYVVLFNPAKDGKQPNPAENRIEADLIFGQKVNIPGPWHNPLWPGQSAEVRRGHQLRLNQYLSVKVYNEEQARNNWGETIAKPVEGSDEPKVISRAPEDLSVGRKFVIKGTEVSFYIPPTGISVIHAEGSKSQYVRDALTLERLEYCILVDEDGNKRYERGPNVVFPDPTEDFIEDKGGRKKFKAVELNEIQGLHVKVIAPYTDENGVAHEEGEELFITGKQQAIYYPREEHSHIKYDGHAKHFATAVPKGEGRYVMDRLKGDIALIKGPAMLLPDPRKEVIVKRAIDEKHVVMWYPGNNEALEFNRELREVAKNVPTTRSGAVSDGDYERMTRSGRKEHRISSKEVAMERSHGNRQQSVAGEEFTRASTYTQPRTVTLGKYDGVPRIDIWTGYAIQVVGPDKRRVVVGPDTVLLEYDEILEIITLSQGKPKTTDHLKQTPYLRVSNNKVSDVIIGVETMEHVRADIKLIYNVDFEGDSSLWFSIENYVKHLCDHCRSVIKGAAKHVSIEALYGDPAGFIRDLILGMKEEEADGERPGMSFPNGMRITDIEVMTAEIQDSNIKNMLLSSQHSIVSNHIQLVNAENSLKAEEQLRKMERTQILINQETETAKLQSQAEISEKRDNIKGEALERAKMIQEEEQKIRFEQILHEYNCTLKGIEQNNAVQEASMMYDTAKLGLRLKELEANSEAVVKRATAISPELATTLKQFSDKVMLSAMIKDLGGHAALQGKSMMDFTKSFFDQMPGQFQALMQFEPPTNGGRKS